MLREHDLKDLIGRIEGDGSYRVLRKLEVDEGRTAVPYYGGDTFIAVVVDVETTGLDTSSDAIIEIAIRRFRFDDTGHILKVDRAWSWLEDPGRPLDAEITRLAAPLAVLMTDMSNPREKVPQDSISSPFVLA